MSKQPAMPQPEAEPLYTPAALAQRWGNATEEDALAYVEGFDKAALINEGKLVATSRIATDSARLFGIVTEFLATATEEQRDSMPALTDKLVRTAVWTAYKAETTYETRAAQRKGASALKDVRVAGAVATIEKGKVCRRQLKSALSALAGKNPTLLAKVDAAHATAADAKELASSIAALVDLGRTMLADTSPAMAARREGSRLDAKWLDRAEALAGEVRANGDAARAVLASTEVSQADVDYWDGLALTLLDSIIDMFEAGNSADPSIPRLVPLALRSYFGTYTRKPKQDK